MLAYWERRLNKMNIMIGKRVQRKHELYRKEQGSVGGSVRQ